VSDEPPPGEPLGDPPGGLPSALHTINADGSRHWIHPRVADGGFWRARRVVAYGLIALFILLPIIKIDGRPALMIDLFTREISFFGALFRPTDGILLMLLGLSIVIAVFLTTALLGRVWCGWGCPQTVWLEFVFRPLDRLFEGPPAKQRALDRKLGPRRLAKWAAYLVIAGLLANVFLAYFVGVERLERWVLTSPSEHLGGFVVVVGVTVLMWLDFAILREQVCIVACPYGRLQSVLLDRKSLIVGYDARRGEPRAKVGKKSLPVIADEPAAERRGDCVDCGACVQVCPTGIDIRNGLQMECIGCAQCIDACKPVMQKLGRPTGLIRYSSQDQLAGQPRKLLRPRVIIYPALLAIVVGLLVHLTANRASADLSVDRIDGAPFVVLPSGDIGAHVRLALEHRGDAPATYTLALVDAPDATLLGAATWPLRPGQRVPISVMVEVPAASFVHGRRQVRLRVSDGAAFDRVIDVPLLGPEHAPAGGAP
jgi:cytochrome c oxidase accessory protein FixG